MQSASGKSTTSGSAPAASAKSGAPTDEAATSAGSSLTDQIKELLVDFDPRSALKAAKKLSVEELQTALALLASIPKSHERDSLREQLYAARAATDPNAAWKAALADCFSRAKFGTQPCNLYFTALHDSDFANLPELNWQYLLT